MGVESLHSLTAFVKIYRPIMFLSEIWAPQFY